MTILGISAGKSADSQVEVGFRRGWFRSFKFVLSSAGGAAAAFALAELLEQRPHEGFGLLQQWGPWPFVVLVALIMGGTFISSISEAVKTSFGAVVASAQMGAEAQGKMADAVTRLADQGGKQAEEVRRLAIYAAQEFPSVYKRFDEQDSSLEELKTLMKSVLIMGQRTGDK